MKKLVVPFLLLFCQFVVAQAIEGGFAVINDKDGYVNVRKEKSVHSKVLKKLDNNTLIFVFEYDKAQEGNWIYADNEGYIYNDRVKWIEKLPKIAKGIARGNTIVFEGKEIQVTLATEKFDKDKHSFKYHKEYRDIIEKIDGKPFWGTDGNIPKKEYKSIEVKIRGKQVSIPKSAYSDLYESYLYTEFNSVYYDKDNDILYIVADNGDGAGAYMVCWQIEKGVYKGRKVGIPF
ncbi:hypothetical protein CAPGI0001_1906 [Capnocytophaga gingivalis ATCC 33624]|uniref:hypothetical protein n=1 Tax=Capnocytophaga gingivalis TaxID=1017 RepID=UPI00019FB23C|nr:hypothetical protein [Capnocytophaga gingivalis]EEK13539.1 hypothetical protein CAPGI0001_1906 [Capnocytophaga gingivalis ATCC 33624]